MSQQQQNNALAVLVLIGLVLVFFYQAGGSAPVAAPGLTALYIEETDDRGRLSMNEFYVFTSKAGNSVKGYLDANAHKTDGAADARFIDKDDELSRDLPVFAAIKARWEAAGRPLPWRHITNGHRYFEGKPTSTADELALLESLK